LLAPCIDSELRIEAVALAASILSLLLNREGKMKKSAILCSLVLILIAATDTASGQELIQASCEFNIVGTWKAPASEYGAELYRFSSDGTVTALSGSESSSDQRELARATYTLNDPVNPTSISFTRTGSEDVFPKGTSTMQIVKFDDVSFTCYKPGSPQARWTRVDHNRYFVVFAARLGTFYDQSGPAFPTLIKMDGRDTQIDAVGLYALKGKRGFGVVPPEVYNEYMREPKTDSETMLRLEINGEQYARGMKVLKHWDRRVREGALLYSKKGNLDNVLLVKQMAENIGQCSNKIKVYNLSYVYDDDWISNKYGAPFVPFYFFKELRRLNETLHVRDEVFRAASPTVASSTGR
jgi:hypothetical protein